MPFFSRFFIIKSYQDINSLFRVDFMIPQTACSNLKSFDKIKQDFFIQSEQDGLFFGLEFLKHILKPYPCSITAYLKDGDCFFKGQTCLELCLPFLTLPDSSLSEDFSQNERIEKQDILSALSYFSGLYTLVSCWTERDFDFSIMAGLTPDFSFPEWEKKAILKAGGALKKPLKNECFLKEEVKQALKKGEEQVSLNSSKMSKKELKEILEEMPPYVEVFLRGSFWPSELEEFRDFNLKSVIPNQLEGYFPSLKMKIIESAG